MQRPVEPDSRFGEYWRDLDEFVLAPMRVLLNDWRGRIGLAIVLTYLLMGTLGVVVLEPPHSSIEDAMLQPFQDWRYPLGTDLSGQGMFTLVVYATVPILKMVSAGAVFAILMGAVVGMVAGYKGGTVDTVLMMLTDILLTLPGLPLVILLAFLFEPRSPYLIGLILAINNWTGLARAIRSQMLTLRDENYVEASRLLGISTPRIIYKDIAPNLMPYIAVNFMQASRRIIFESVALYFLGILPFSQPNWGVIMNLAYQQGTIYSLSGAHWMLVPMFTIVLFSLGLIFLAQGADQVFNPRVRARHAKTVPTESEDEEVAESGTTTTAQP